MTYPDSVQFLYALGNETKAMKLGLGPISTLLEAMGSPQKAFRVVHVAGTNGKGSTCAMIEAGLRAQGLKTGLYTSPHLVEPTERIRIDGIPVTSRQFSEAFDTVHETATRLMEQGRLEAHPSYFETVTAMGFHLFRKARIEIAVVEVGLGGRLDATNTVMPELTVITPIDFDHEQWLGSSIEAIAGEKAGILKPGAPLVLGRQHHKGARDTILERAAGKHVAVTEAAGLQRGAATFEPFGCRLSIAAEQPIELHCGLAGEHQADNAVTAAVALSRLGLAPAAIRNGIQWARWPGRLERVATKPDIILDGAHNPAGVRALASYIRRFFAGRRVWMIYATMRDKSVDEIGETLAPVASEIVLTQADSPRALRPDALRELFDHPRVRTAPRLIEAVALVRREASPEDAIFITGSLYLVGEAYGVLGIAPEFAASASPGR